MPVASPDRQTTRARCSRGHTGCGQPRQQAPATRYPNDRLRQVVWRKSSRSSAIDPPTAYAAQVPERRAVVSRRCRLARLAQLARSHSGFCSTTVLHPPTFPSQRFTTATTTPAKLAHRRLCPAAQHERHPCAPRDHTADGVLAVLQACGQAIFACVGSEWPKRPGR